MTICCRTGSKLLRWRRAGMLLGLAAILLLIAVHDAQATVLTVDTEWSGEVELNEDLLIPSGITLTIAAGTIIKIVPAESTKTDPEYLSPLTEITVRGHLEAEGEAGRPVIFRLPDGTAADKKWGGIKIDQGNAWLRQTTVQGADVGVHVLQGWAKIKESRLDGNRCGLIVQGESSGAKLEKSMVRNNEYGIMVLNGAKLVQEESQVSGNRSKDVFSRANDLPGCEKPEPAEPAAGSITRTLENDSLVGNTVWQGRIRINGTVRLPEGSRLIIQPGTVIEFTRRDTNQDGIGENGLQLQGTIIAKGTPDKPIVFRSAEPNRRRGDWDAVNIMGSDSTQNLLEYCRIEDAYRGLHFHFANVAVNHAVLRNNYRGIQFQESLVSVRNSLFHDNKSGIQARDSEVIFNDNQLYNNYNGANFFRLNLQAQGNRFYGNAEDGIRIREGRAILDRNVMDANQFGLRIADTVYGQFTNNIISNNSETGLSLRNDDNIEVAGNVIQFNGISGITIQDSGGLIRHNLISDNGERGIGVESFAGRITENNIVENSGVALDIDGPGAVAAPMNWWGSRPVAQSVFDGHDDPALGKAAVEPVQPEPFDFDWQHDVIRTAAAWHGNIRLASPTVIARNNTLTVAPGTGVAFAAGSGLRVEGALQAVGTPDNLITFTMAAAQADTAGLDSEEPAAGDGLLFDRAAASVLRYCSIAHATWAVHSHFTPLTIADCRFIDNYGGIRFRSGPLQVERSYFARNHIAIRAFEGNAVITENVFTGNEIGIFVRSGGSGLAIHRNNIFANSRYSIRLGDFNTEDVDARENWWGEAGPGESIFDAAQEAGIGRVLTEPGLPQPIPATALQQ